MNEFLLSDCEMLCGTLAKILQFNENTGALMIDWGLLDEKINLILKLGSSFHDKEKGNNNKHQNMVPSHTDLDGVFISVREVLKPVASNLNNDANEFWVY